MNDDIRHYARSKPGVWTRDSTFVSGQPQVSCVNSRLINPTTLVLLTTIFYLVAEYILSLQSRGMLSAFVGRKTLSFTKSYKLDFSKVI